MRPEITELAAFYRSPRGRLAARLIRRRLQSLAPEHRAARVLGLGYAAPFLEGFAPDAERLVALMPREQGGVPWPSPGPGRSAVVQETMLPLADQSVDVVLLAHAVEATDRVHRLLREVWRVLADNGRLVAVVPNRRGLWCFAERTPFGYGRPYSASQLNATLEANLFTPLRRERALYTPPFRSKVLLRTAPLWESAGARVARQLSGIILVEAVKSVVAATPVPADSRQRSPKVYALPARSAAACDAEDVPRATAPARAVAFTSRRRRG